MGRASREGESRAPLLAILAFALVPILFHIVIFETRHARFSLSPSLPGLTKIGFVAAAAVSHWGIYTSLLLTFGLTLRRGREPLITTMARRMHGNLSDEMVWYTARVTQAWCCFFAFQLTASITLFCFAPLVVWSGFVNILDLPMVVLMFSAEYFCRLRLLRNPPRHSFSAILSMVTDPAGNAHAKQLVPARIAAPD
jgi:hypothetical protein